MFFHFLKIYEAAIIPLASGKRRYYNTYTYYKEVNTMKCPKCHAEIPDDARFCTECGANLQPVRQQRVQVATAGADTAFAFGQAARRARLEAYVDPNKIISSRAYNAILIGVLVWGFLINVILCTFAGNVVNSINPIAFLVGYLVLVFGGIMLTNRSHNPALSFLGYNMVVVPFGLVLSVVVQEYGGMDSRVVRDALAYTFVITLAMLGLELMFPTFFEKLGMALLGLLIGLIVCEVVLALMHVQQTAIDWVAAGIFSLYIAYDIHRSQQFPKTVDNAIDSALDIYLDIANLFIRLLRIFGSKKRD